MATNKNPKGPPSGRVALYDKLVGTFQDVERKGATMPYTSLNGNMFSFLDATGVLALRLPAEERDRFVSDHNTVLFVAHGIALKEYVTVPDHLLKDIRAMKRYFAMSLAYARTLKPKATKRPRKK